MTAREIVPHWGDATRRAMVARAARHVAPIVFSAGGEPVGNATVTFLDLGRGPFAVTADHVLDGWRARRRATPALECAIGGLAVAPESRLVDRDADRDLAVFRIEAGELARLGKTPYRPRHAWPPPRPAPGGAVFFAGFPGTGRRRAGDGALAFRLYAAATEATSVNDRVVVCQFDPGRWIDTAGRAEPPSHDRLGGLSGAPLWAVGGGDRAWRLAGFVVSFNDGWALLYAKHAASLAREGRLAPPPLVVGA